MPRIEQRQRASIDMVDRLSASTRDEGHIDLRADRVSNEMDRAIAEQGIRSAKVRARRSIFLKHFVRSPRADWFLIVRDMRWVQAKGCAPNGTSPRLQRQRQIPELSSFQPPCEIRSQDSHCLLLASHCLRFWHLQCFFPSPRALVSSTLASIRRLHMSRSFHSLCGRGLHQR